MTKRPIFLFVYDAFRSDVTLLLGKLSFGPVMCLSLHAKVNSPDKYTLARLRLNTNVDRRGDRQSPYHTTKLGRWGCLGRNGTCSCRLCPVYGTILVRS
jgi:hypothetical protein